MFTKSEISQITLCFDIAKKAHKDQTRRGGSPYFEHPHAVSESTVVRDDCIMKCVSLLHDTIEDTGMTAEKLLDLGVWKEIVDIIVCLTKTSNESYDKFIDKIIARGNDKAIIVKIADIVSNLTDCPNARQIDKYTRALTKLAFSYKEFERPSYGD